MNDITNTVQHQIPCLHMQHPLLPRIICTEHQLSDEVQRHQETYKNRSHINIHISIYIYQHLGMLPASRSNCLLQTMLAFAVLTSQMCY